MIGKDFHLNFLASKIEFNHESLQDGKSSNYVIKKKVTLLKWGVPTHLINVPHL